MQLILASSSFYRKQLLTKLGLSFVCVSPDIDETPIATEKVDELTLRLAKEKAYEVSKKHQGIIIASDQNAVLGNKLLTKPNNFDNAFKQLKKSSDKTITFFTSICLLNTYTNNMQLDVDCYEVTFRKLTDNEITNYLKKDKPYDCVGSFKSEGLGIALFKKLKGDDPNTLIGLPLIKLIKMLKNENISVL